jgi:hypothetical protein
MQFPKMNAQFRTKTPPAGEEHSSKWETEGKLLYCSVVSGLQGSSANKYMGTQN